LLGFDDVIVRKKHVHLMAVSDWYQSKKCVRRIIIRIGVDGLKGEITVS